MSTIPLSVSNAQHLVLTLFISFFAIAALVFIISLTSANLKEVAICVALSLAVLALAGGLILALFKFHPLVVNAATTEKDIKTQYGITYDLKDKIDRTSFSEGEEQKTVSISNVDLLTGKSYPTGAIVSRNGHVAVYVFEKGSEEPIALELTTDTLFPQP